VYGVGRDISILIITIIISDATGNIHTGSLDISDASRKMQKASLGISYSWKPLETSEKPCSKALSLSVNPKMELLAMHCKDKIVLITYAGEMEELPLEVESAILDSTKPSLYYVVGKMFNVRKLDTVGSLEVELSSLSLFQQDRPFSRKLILASGHYLYGVGDWSFAQLDLDTCVITPKSLHEVCGSESVDDVQICAIPWRD